MLFSGISVPASGNNLLKVGFSASADARGRFHILASSDSLVGSMWSSTDGVQHDFANVPFSSGDAAVIGSVLIGAVEVAAVPEPSTAALGLLAVGVSLFLRQRQQLVNRLLNLPAKTFLGRK
jgi:hypothetical protein